jgi:hypothetical protein
MRESEARVMIRTALAAAGLKDGGGIVLFGGDYLTNARSYHALICLRSQKTLPYRTEVAQTES